MRPAADPLHYHVDLLVHGSKGCGCGFLIFAFIFFACYCAYVSIVKYDMIYWMGFNKNQCNYWVYVNQLTV